MDGRIQVAVTKIHFATEVEPKRDRHIYVDSGLGVPDDTIDAIVERWLASGAGFPHEMAREAIVALLEHVGPPQPHPADRSPFVYDRIGGGRPWGAIEP